MLVYKVTIQLELNIIAPAGLNEMIWYPFERKN